MIDQSNNEQPTLSPQDLLQLQSMAFDLANKNSKATYFGVLQAVGKFMIENEGIHPKNIAIQVETGFKLSRKSNIQRATRMPPPGNNTHGG